MAAINVTSQHILDPERNGTYQVLSRCVRSAAVSDTVELPEGLLVCADLSTGTAATVACSGTTATITGGLAGANLRLVSLHGGNAAAL